MDFVRTLLAFMAITLAANVQGAPVPEVTVPPTNPPAIVTPAPEGGLVNVQPQSAATPTPTPEAAPTITPNKSYRTLRVGDKGNNVKKLQNRLIELGYLNGNADGAYGTQTRTAVRLFQKENGLQRDGVAGPATLTVLYEDPNVKPNPAVITPTPVPSPTPDSNGLVPLLDNPLADWRSLAGTRILLNGSAVTLPNGGIPMVYMRGLELMIGLNGLAAGTDGWLLTPGTAAQGFVLDASGYRLEAALRSNPAVIRAADDDSYWDLYTLTVDGRAVECRQGDLVSEYGSWYISGSLLERVFGAQLTLDEEEHTLILRLPAKGAAQSAD